MAKLLNQVLADTRILHDLYKKTHWLMRGRTFYQLHLLMDKHAAEQAALVDTMAERIQTLGAVAVGDPRHVAELTSIPRPPDGVEEVPAMLSRLLEAHELVIEETRDAAKRADDAGDDSTNDILVSDVLRTNELQVWFVAEHLVVVSETPNYGVLPFAGAGAVGVAAGALGSSCCAAIVSPSGCANSCSAPRTRSSSRTAFATALA
jgi:starvation-inducible DNA-binding protein